MNLFYKIFTDSQNKRNTFNHALYTWNCHPKRDEAWKQETIRNTSAVQFSAEHECKFLGSSNTLISGEALELLSFSDPISQTEDYKCYKNPEKDHIYIACVDVSEGVGRDYSSIVIIDVSVKPYEQVFIYHRNDISPWWFPEIIVKMAIKYNNAYLLVENNNIGKIVADGIFYEYDYENMLSSKVKQQDEKVDGYAMKNIGIQMNKKTKMIGCASLKALIEENFLKIHDWGTIQELASFVKVNTSYQAEKSKYDDLIMPLVLFGWLTTQTYFEDLTQTGMRELVKERKDKDAENTHLAFGFFSDGIDNYEKSFLM